MYKIKIILKKLLNNINYDIIVKILKMNKKNIYTRCVQD